MVHHCICPRSKALVCCTFFIPQAVWIVWGEAKRPKGTHHLFLVIWPPDKSPQTEQQHTSWYGVAARHRAMLVQHLFPCRLFPVSVIDEVRGLDNMASMCWQEVHVIDDIILLTYPVNLFVHVGRVTSKNNMTGYGKSAPPGTNGRKAIVMIHPLSVLVGTHSSKACWGRGENRNL